MYFHYDNVIMSAIASQITNFTIVYSTVHSDADQRKHQSSAALAFVRRIHRAGEFSAQMASNAENVSIWWRHHGRKPQWKRIQYTHTVRLSFRLCYSLTSIEFDKANQRYFTCTGAMVQFHQPRLVIRTFHRQGRCSRGGHLCNEHSEEKYSCSYK